MKNAESITSFQTKILVHILQTRKNGCFEYVCKLSYLKGVFHDTIEALFKGFNTWDAGDKAIGWNEIETFEVVFQITNIEKKDNNMLRKQRHTSEVIQNTIGLAVQIEALRYQII